MNKTQNTIKIYGTSYRGHHSIYAMTPNYGVSLQKIGI